MIEHENITIICSVIRILIPVRSVLLVHHHTMEVTNRDISMSIVEVLYNSGTTVGSESRLVELVQTE
jgi:hypothetical protein